MLPRTIAEKIETDYGILIKSSKILGSGSNGSVYKLESEDGCVMCVKAIGLSNDSAQTEIEIAGIYYRSLGFDVKNYQDDNYCYVTTPFYAGDPLSKIIANVAAIPAAKRRKIFIKLDAAIKKMHFECGILHRDLKADNVIVCTQPDEPEVYIIDFGRSVRIFDHITGKPLSTPESLSLYKTNTAWYSFMYYPVTQLLRRWYQTQTAPEYTALDSHTNGFNHEAENVGFRSDYYSLGMLFKQLLPEEAELAAGVVNSAGPERSSSYQQLVKDISQPDIKLDSKEITQTDAPSL